MCGIFGFVSPQVERPGEFYRFTSRLFVESQIRGTDASGFAALVNSDSIVTDKRPYPAQYFTKLSKPWRNLRGAKKINLIGHTRAATSGSPKDNKNNHPFHGPRFVIAHNGWIGSHETIAEYNNIKLKTQCDSELILHFLERGATVRQGIIEALNHLDDVSNLAVSVLDKSTGNIHLFRNTGSPCSIIRFKRWNAVVYASTLRIIVDAATNIADKWGNLSDHAELLFNGDIPPMTDVIIRPNGMVEHHKLDDQLNLVKYKRTNHYSPAWFESDEYSEYYSRWSGLSKTSVERLRQTAMEDSKLEETAHDVWTCVGCQKPLHQSKANYPDPLKREARGYVCETCYREIHQSADDDAKDDVEKAKRRVLKMIVPTSLMNRDNPLDTILNWREAAMDYELDANEQAVYMRCLAMPTERKIDHWSGVSYRSILEMSDGEYLAYVDFVGGCLMAE